MFSFKAPILAADQCSERKRETVAEKYLTRCGTRRKKRTTSKNRAPTSYEHTKDIYIYIYIYIPDRLIFLVNRYLHIKNDQ